MYSLLISTKSDIDFYGCDFNVILYKLDLAYTYWVVTQDKYDIHLLGQLQTIDKRYSLYGHTVYSLLVQARYGMNLLEHSSIIHSS